MCIRDRLKRWIAMPVKDTVQINERLDVVGHFVEDADLADTPLERPPERGT